MPVAEYTPTLAELGRFLKTRTRTRMGGAAAGTFNDTTALTAVEAQALIDEAADEVALSVGADLKDGPVGSENMYREGAKALVLLLAAMNVELALVPEQTSDPRSAYSALERRFNSFRDTLVEALGGEDSSVLDETMTDETGAIISELTPWYSFPPTTIGDGIMP